MARATSSETSLSETLDAGGGLKQFRAVSERPQNRRDSPFGQPTPKERGPESEGPPAKSEPRAPKPKKAAPVTTAAKPKPAPREAEPDPEPTPGTVQALYTENVTLPLSTELRDRSEELAKALNRSRSVKKLRLTRNSVIRVALQCFLDEFEPPTDGSVNSEEELLEAFRQARPKRN